MGDDIVEHLKECAKYADEYPSDRDAFNAAADEIERLREENARLRRLFKTAYAEGCYDCTKTVKTTEEFEALWEGSFAYKVILEGAKDG